MEKNRFMSFVTSLIPGVGYMYRGLMKKGVEALAIFLLINPVFQMLDLYSLGHILTVIFWCYAFFDTIGIDGKIRRGEAVTDSGIFFRDDKPLDFNLDRFKTDGNKFIAIIGVVLVVVGTIVLLNRIFVNFNIYYYIKSYVGNFIVPAALIAIGILMLFKNKKRD